MNKIINKPHLFFFAIAPLFILISFFRSDANFGINIHDTYFVIAISHLCYLSAVFFALIGLNYFLLFWAKKPHKRALTSMHIIFQIISILLYIYAMFSIPENNNLIQTPFPPSVDESILFVLSFILFLIAITIHFINFLTSLLSKRE